MAAACLRLRLKPARPKTVPTARASPANIGQNTSEIKASSRIELSISCCHLKSLPRKSIVVNICPVNIHNTVMLEADRLSWSTYTSQHATTEVQSLAKSDSISSSRSFADYQATLLHNNAHAFPSAMVNQICDVLRPYAHAQTPRRHPKPRRNLASLPVAVRPFSENAFPTGSEQRSPSLRDAESMAPNRRQYGLIGANRAKERRCPASPHAPCATTFTSTLPRVAWL